jgi:hypothetical protein
LAAGCAAEACAGVFVAAEVGAFVESGFATELAASSETGAATEFATAVKSCRCSQAGFESKSTADFGVAPESSTQSDCALDACLDSASDFCAKTESAFQPTAESESGFQPAAESSTQSDCAVDACLDSASDFCAETKSAFESGAESRLEPTAESKSSFQPAAKSAAQAQGAAFMTTEPELVRHRLLQTGNRIAFSERKPRHSGRGR